MLCRGGKLMSESDRLGPLLKNLTNSYMGVSEGDGLADRLSLAELDAAAKRSFPLCMKALYVARCMLPNAHSRSAWRRCTYTRMHGQLSALRIPTQRRTGRTALLCRILRIALGHS